MPYAESNGIKLYYEETGSGDPIVFVHEFADDFRSWENQMNYFSRRYRCIAYNARGYPPSDVPENVGAYSQKQATEDIVNVIRHLKIEKAHVVGLSMGSSATLPLGIDYPDTVLSLTVAGGGYGAFSENREQSQIEAMERVENLEKEISSENGGNYAVNGPRLTFKKKDPRGWLAFAKRFSEHSSLGSALTVRGLTASRPSFIELEQELKKIKVPVLLIAGDEDTPSLEPIFYLKTIIPSAALWIFPKTGHAVNLEEPDLFNRALQDFISTVSADRWEIRDFDSQNKRMI